LKKHQDKVIEASSKKDFGVIIVPSGSGKTIMGLKIVTLLSISFTPELTIIPYRCKTEKDA
jgi:superfamily II DNA or RNA helicase